MEAGSGRHPVGLIVTDDLRRSRLTVFLRLLLAIPHFVLLYLWGIAVAVSVLCSWLVALFAGRVPAGLHDFGAAYLRYSTRVSAYVLLLADPYPPFSSAGSYPVDARVDPAAPQSRLSVLFRLLLAIPAGLLVYVFRTVNTVLAVFGWFYALALGSMNRGLRDVRAWMLRYEVQTYAYVLLLTGRYPSLGGAPTA
ncbi:MAG TPA: DUF4389 domain-containing protein [Gaiellaceae bacterium]|nr:DUF4389 domain-containing protein [Gaiellaceae bacterium]